ncbi:hypothetical protein SDC9_195449 [bioreactor metagenome]|uniref:Uncharacterized protein n=1 Tax=bioreactor metagenome TaxID=1076179 RepID=A0A645I925_9ZZZZ
MTAVGAGAGGIFTQQYSGGCHVLIQGAVGVGVDHVHPVAQHRNHAAAGAQRALQRGGVHALGDARDHQAALPGQLSPQPARGF